MPQELIISKTNTRIFTERDATIVSLHNTNVVTFNADMIRLDTGGWFTNTTKRRMNQVSNQYNLGYYVIQIKGKRYADYNGIRHSFGGTMLTLNRHARKECEVLLNEVIA